MASEVERGLRERLELFQVFTQVYQHHRDWLKRLVNLDQAAIAALNPASMHYIQGIVSPAGAYLVSNLTTGNSQTFMASDTGWLLGRDPRQADLSVLDRQLSRCHARLQYVADVGFVLSDVGSTNGTFINGCLLEAPQCLRDGDQIRLGSLTVFFFACLAARPHPPTASTLSGQVPVLGPSGTTTLPGSE
ncbi:MAG: FHA domain-containing protein [Cyanobacteria bacterium J06632_22]